MTSKSDYLGKIASLLSEALRTCPVFVESV